MEQRTKRGLGTPMHTDYIKLTMKRSTECKEIKIKRE